jgi:nucleotide-binding universal stress UspA family protein
MSIFPTKIFLATDGSEEAELAARTAADLAKSTKSELHLIYVGHMPSIFYESPGTMALDPDLQSRMEEEAEKAAKTNLEKQAQKIRQVGIEVAGIHTRVGFPAAEIVRLAGRLGAGLILWGAAALDR